MYVCMRKRLPPYMYLECKITHQLGNIHSVAKTTIFVQAKQRYDTTNSLMIKHDTKTHDHVYD